MMKLNYFENLDNFYTGLQSLFKSLNVPVNYIDEKSLKPQDILSKAYKETNPSYLLMDDVYILGMVDDAAFANKNSEEIFKIKKTEKDYDGILVFGVTLKERENDLLPTRTQLAEVTRAFNREFHYTPVVVVFRYENFISLANTERLKYKQEWREGEKAGKVSILRDVDITNPHTGHLKILEELKITRSGTKGINSFEGLYQYWQEVFSVSLLSKKFYSELSNWYFWAIKHVTFPSESIYKDDKNYEYKAQNVIRLLTRLLFVWFIKEKKLIPEELFDLDALQKNILDKIAPYHEEGLFKEENKESVYYKSILQNLFFATLNCPIKPDSVDSRERGFRGDESYGKHRGVDYLMRHKKHFKDPDAYLEMVNEVVPFLNGGLFECLDDKENNIYIDGFSDNMTKGHRLIVPDYLFFGREEKADLSSDYGVNNKGTKEAAVKGLINILKSYKFTIAENTPIEEDVALDPELLGKVFENLLASYNPETKTTARKQTGSFYTPREIVNYMVDESLIAHLKNSVSSWDMEEKELDEQLHKLVSFGPVNPFENNSKLLKEIIHSLDSCKILDPACGSGAFPMGILQKMVHILQKVDTNNEYWQDLQYNKAIKETEGVFVIKDKEEREQLLLEINEAFDETINNPDYARKLFLIENCIYGVDIQPIATQISKLRFFISLVVEQKVNKEKENFGIRPLPNLETKFVTANTLIGIEKEEGLFYTKEVQEKEVELKAIRHKLFGAKTKATKVKYRKKDEELRNEIADILKKGNLPVESAEQLASWDPYDQNASSAFFDPEWMFDIKEGFDVVIGNPPYGAKLSKNEVKKYKEIFELKTSETAMLFVEKGGKILNKFGTLTYIVPKALTYSSNYKRTRDFILDGLRLIVDCGKAFEQVKLEATVFSFSKNLNADYYLSYKYDDVKSFNLQSIINKKYVEQFNLLLNGVDEKELNLGLLLHDFQKLDKCISNKRGATIQKHIRNEKDTIVALGGKEISRNAIKGMKGFISNRILQENKNSIIKDNSVLCQNIVAHILNPIDHIKIIALVPPDNHYAIADTINQLEIINTSIGRYALWCILNSKLINWYIYRFIYGKAIRTMHFDSPITDRIPIVYPQKNYIYEVLHFAVLNQTDNYFFENVINALVFNLYFSDHMKERKIDILQFIEKDIAEIMQGKEFEKLSNTQKELVIAELHKRWNDSNSEIVKRMNSFAEKSPEILKPILES